MIFCRLHMMAVKCLKIMGARRHGHGGDTCSPCKCCKVFYALAVTVKYSVDQLFLHYCHNFFEVWSCSFWPASWEFWGQRPKKVNLFEEKVRPRENLGYPYKFAHPRKKILRSPMKHCYVMVHILLVINKILYSTCLSVVPWCVFYLFITFTLLVGWHEGSVKPAEDAAAAICKCLSVAG